MKNVSIFVGTVYGTAQYVAEQIKQKLNSINVAAEIFETPSIQDFQQAETILVVTSTTGQGDIPDNLFAFFDSDLRDQFPLMSGKAFAVIGLGDSSYGDIYVGAGTQFFDLLIELQGKPLDNMLAIDASETLEPESVALPWLEKLLNE
jgi:flavodoxin